MDKRDGVVKKLSFLDRYLGIPFLAGIVTRIVGMKNLHTQNQSPDSHLAFVHHFRHV
jgi:ACR3 family arsenite efflux pump ArsB